MKNSKQHLTDAFSSLQDAQINLRDVYKRQGNVPKLDLDVNARSNGSAAFFI